MAFIEKKDVFKPKRDFIPSQTKLVMSSIEMIEPDHNQVRLADGSVLPYDYLVIATGADIHPEETPGLAEDEWGKSIHTFYSMDGAEKLAQQLRTWQGGRLVVNVVENPIKCPVAPLEFLMLADWFSTNAGSATALSWFMPPRCRALSPSQLRQSCSVNMLETKKIMVEPEYMIERVDPDAKKIVSYDEREVEYDLLVSVPLNKGADVVGKSGLGDELNFSPVNKHTFLSDKYANIFVLGDASNAPASKAGSVAHFAVDLFGENFLHHTKGQEIVAPFDGHANCFVKSGYGKGMLIDFNYTPEPLPGRYPFPVVGPFALLEESRLNQSVSWHSAGCTGTCCSEARRCRCLPP